MSDLINRTLLRNEFVKYIDVFDLTAWNKINDIIDNASAVDISGNEYFPYRTAYFNGVADATAAMARSQGELAEKLKDRIEENVCKYCQMNKNCVLCEISRVFQIITLTAEEQKGGVMRNE